MSTIKHIFDSIGSNTDDTMNYDAYHAAVKQIKGFRLEIPKSHKDFSISMGDCLTAKQLYKQGTKRQLSCIHNLDDVKRHFQD